MIIKDSISSILREERIKEEVILNKETLDELIRFSKNNEILYYVLSLVIKQGEGTEPIKKLYSSKESLSREVVVTTAEISNAFDKKGLRSFPMKTFRRYPYVDDDIDIVVVEPRRIDEYANLLKEMGYRLKPDRSALREPGKRFYVKQDITGKSGLLKIHLHSSVSWNGIGFLDAYEVWKNSRLVNMGENKVRILSVEDEILIMSAHAIHENAYITIGELIHLKKMLSGDKPVNTRYMSDASRRYNWNPALRSYLAYADAYHRYITGEAILNTEIKEALGVIDTHAVFTIERTFPYLLPAFMLLGLYSRKIVADIMAFKLRQIPREVFSFWVITWLLRIRKIAKF